MNVGVIIGRFQPFHKGHADLLKSAAEQCKELIIVLGSTNRHQSVKNPFTAFERKAMIRDWRNDNLPETGISFVESVDNLYKEWTWKSHITRRVNDLIPSGVNVKLFGHFKDDSSYYLNEFPEWELVNMPSFGDIDATDIREKIFAGEPLHEIRELPKTTIDFIYDRLMDDVERIMNLREERQFYIMERERFKSYPFPDTLNFMCSDAVVLCKGHVLLIERKIAPGKGTWALPGGFKNADETFEQCCLRELKEETNLRVPEKVLKGSIKDVKMFDSPVRNIGIPKVTMAHYIEVDTNHDGSLPEIRPASDAYNADWFELSDAMTMNLFDDHEDIIRWFV